ncbi:hypothetical protein chiPu_0023725, partial [Chiloscyllium punctatum]|nr:hypothetical protein [Chiloscyllium punctatum]
YFGYLVAEFVAKSFNRSAVAEILLMPAVLKQSIDVMFGADEAKVINPGKCQIDRYRGGNGRDVSCQWEVCFAD